MEFLALNWSVTERFHEYLYGGICDVYTDNNPLTYVLTSAKLDATGQHWIASLANYNFKIFYRSGKLNVDADSLSRIHGTWSKFRSTPLDLMLARAAVLQSKMRTKVPMLPNAVISVCELIIRSELRLTKQQWRTEQRNDYLLNRLIQLVETGGIRD